MKLHSFCSLFREKYKKADLKVKISFSIRQTNNLSLFLFFFEWLGEDPGRNVKLSRKIVVQGRKSFKPKFFGIQR
jgi:hypothetical protein